VARLGIGSTLGLLAVVSLPSTFVFRPSGDDPHPVPYIRVLLSCGIGNALYPHPQWATLAGVWKRLYPTDRVSPGYRRTLTDLERTIGPFVDLLVDHQPPALKGRSLAEALSEAERRPERLLANFASWRRRPAAMAQAPPSLVFATLGQARAADTLRPELESRVLGNLLTHWALRSTLDTSAICADQFRSLARLRAS
jgi:hypothetical protein